MALGEPGAAAAGHQQPIAFIHGNRKSARRRTGLLATAAALALIAPAAAQEEAATACAAATSCTVGDTVIYLPAFFSQYNPVTALDMVSRVPGFSIDSGDNVRGFGAAGGNVLIDGQRPSTKSASLQTVLSRIGASDVERIELIRGGTGSLDVAGQSVVVNVVKKKGAEDKSSSPWEFWLLQRRPRGSLTPGGEISYSGKTGSLKYTLGASGYAAGLTYGGDETITRYFDEDETREREGGYHEHGYAANINLERPFDNGDVARLNIEASKDKSRETTVEFRYPESGGTNIAIFPFPYEQYQYEVGGDYEHHFTEKFGAKLIGLFKRRNEKYDSGFEYYPDMDDDYRSLFSSDRNIGETIGRVEFDWKGWENHAIQFGGEVAHNFIDSEAEYFVDDGMGGLEQQALDGANTRVTELRGEPFITDSWKAGSKLKVDIGMAVELSRIAQSGDSENSRFFVYPKPSLTFTYDLTPKTQIRLSGKRDVNQLSFGEFVSSVNFDDEDFDFGNPELQPQRTWEFELAFERRFGEIGVIELTTFYHLVNDVEDLLPIGGVVEVPGNIGDGEAWGATLDFTVPLDAVGLKNARLESEVTVQDSSVRDPVTGEDRQFSYFNDYVAETEFRQDFPKARFSWGWSFIYIGEEAGYGLDELTYWRYPKPDSAIFVESTVLKGVKIRLQANDLFNFNNQRNRTVYMGSRALNVPAFDEIRSNMNGGGVTLTFSGTL